MTEHVTEQELADWRWQCEERIRRWKQQRATPQWHLPEHDLLRILDDLAAVHSQVERAEANRDRQKLRANDAALRAGQAEARVAGLEGALGEIRALMPHQHCASCNQMIDIARRAVAAPKESMSNSGT